MARVHPRRAAAAGADPALCLALDRAVDLSRIDARGRALDSRQSDLSGRGMESLARRRARPSLGARHGDAGDDDADDRALLADRPPARLGSGLTFANLPDPRCCSVCERTLLGPSRAQPPSLAPRTQGREREGDFAHAAKPHTVISHTLQTTGSDPGAIEAAGRQHLGDAFARIEHTGLHRVLRHPDDFRDIFDGTFVIVDQIDDLAMRRRQLREALAQDLIALGLLYRGLRILGRILDEFEDILVQLLGRAPP